MLRQLILPATLLFATFVSGEQAVACGFHDRAAGLDGGQAIRGQQENGETVINTAPSEPAVHSGKDRAAALPMGIQLYPGAEIQPGITERAAGTSGAPVVFHLTESADCVIEFYRKELESNDIMFITEVKTADRRMIVGDRADGEGVKIAVEPSPRGGVTVTISDAGDKP